MNLDSLNTQQLGTLLGLTTRQVWELGNKGLPSTGLGKKKRFVWNVCRDWYIARKVEELLPKRPPIDEDGKYRDTLEAQQTRKTAADAARAEIKLARERGEVVPVELVKQKQIKVNAIIKSRLLVVPTKVAPIGANKPMQALKSILESEMREALMQLSQETIQ